MAQSKTINIKGVGPVLFERSTRARRLNISVKPFRGVRVALPRGVSFGIAEQTVYEKMVWIQKHLPKMKRIEKECGGVSKKAVGIDVKQAREILIAKLDELATRHGFTYNRVFIRNQKTRWGSCSSKNNINLNLKLILLPEELRDFVILHELVHTKLKRHDTKFWAELVKIEPNTRALASRLAQQNLHNLSQS
jgi:predicted metal-dependent hydrolase